MTLTKSTAKPAAKKMAGKVLTSAQKQPMKVTVTKRTKKPNDPNDVVVVDVRSATLAVKISSTIGLGNILVDKPADIFKRLLDLGFTLLSLGIIGNRDLQYVWVRSTAA